MKDDSLLEEWQKRGLVTASHTSLWREAVELLGIFDAIGRAGANALIKIDGSRPDGSIYTVVISGGQLGDAFFRKDGTELPALLEEAISFYRTRMWTTQG